MVLTLLTTQTHSPPTSTHSLARSINQSSFFGPPFLGGGGAIWKPFPFAGLGDAGNVAYMDGVPGTDPGGKGEVGGGASAGDPTLPLLEP